MTPAAAEPFMPAEGTAVLENLAFDLAREASELSAQLHPVVWLSVADLVRSMNCYFSNLIEATTPILATSIAPWPRTIPAIRIAAICSSRHGPTSKFSR